MRAFLLLLCCLTAAGAAERTPREGSGWAGFRPGTWIKLKRTSIPKNRAPIVTLWETRLTKEDGKTLTLETKTRHALGMEETSINVVPLRGEAGIGEKENTERLEEQTVDAAGRSYRCTRTRTTVTGPNGKRIITKWAATTESKVWVKRTEVRTDMNGRVTLRSTWLLSSLAETKTIDTRAIRCLKYKVLEKAAGTEYKNVVYVSRAMPGSVVWMDGKGYRAGEQVLEFRLQALDVIIK